MSYQAARQRTMYFIGVTTNKSSIMKVFPAWSKYLDLDAEMKGVDFAPNSEPDAYRQVVKFIKDDPLSLGGLVTTHKVNLLKASKDLFDELDPYARTLHEISSISKRHNRLVGHAKDPISAGASFDAIVPDGYWKASGGELCILGSGGSSLALTLYLHNKKLNNLDTPHKIVVTARREAPLTEMRNVHQQIGFNIPVEYILAPTPIEADAIVSRLKDHSMVINATGLGKDGPGSPLTNAVIFPKGGLIWEFNYRGDLVFLDQARAAIGSRDLTVHDGWVYFIHGWTRVISEVFEVDIPMAGPVFDELSLIAREATR